MVTTKAVLSMIPIVYRCRTAQRLAKCVAHYHARMDLYMSIAYMSISLVPFGGGRCYVNDSHAAVSVFSETS